MPLIPITPTLIWSEGAILFLKMANTSFPKEEAAMVPAVRAEAWYKNFFLDDIAISYKLRVMGYESA
jgi:hypothetical protein